MQRERKPKNFLPKPIYRGGPKAMSRFISENLKYPAEAVEKRIEGTVVLRIAIDYKGKVSGSQIKSGIGHGCDEEAQRIVMLLKFDIYNKMRKGKVLFHKIINIYFRLPTASPKKKAEPVNEVQLSYHIVKKKPSPKPASYQYTISIER